MSQQVVSLYDLLDNASPFLRFLGHEQPARAIVDSAVQSGRLPLQVRLKQQIDSGPRSNGYDAYADSTLIDMSLSIAHSDAHISEPPAGVGYAGLNPSQRFDFLSWTSAPTKPAPEAYRHLYLASLEVRLLEDDTMLRAAHRELVQLGLHDSWANNPGLCRAILLGFWLRQDGSGLAKWIKLGKIPSELMSVALGFLALLSQSLDIDLLARVLETWDLTTERVTTDVLKMRLSSLTRSVGNEPLAYLLEELADEAHAFLPWRCINRDIRIAIPQPDLRPRLEPLLADMLVLVDLPATSRVVSVRESAASYGYQDTEITQEVPEESRIRSGTDWQLILQFGQSRSEFFPHVLAQCQKFSGFTQLMDENRQMVYRVIFTKAEMRKFWRIWDYVQNWSTTTVYLNGEELEKWKIWPYSQYLR